MPSADFCLAPKPWGNVFFGGTFYFKMTDAKDPTNWWWKEVVEADRFRGHETYGSQFGHLDWMFQGCQVVLGTPNFNTCDVDGGLPGGDLFPETEAHTQKSHGDFRSADSQHLGMPRHLGIPSDSQPCARLFSLLEGSLISGKRRGVSGDGGPFLSQCLKHGKRTRWWF